MARYIPTPEEAERLRATGRWLVHSNGWCEKVGGNGWNYTYREAAREEREAAIRKEKEKKHNGHR